MWLQSNIIWILLVSTTGGLETQLAVYTTPQACEAAREEYSKRLAEGLGLSAECRQRVRTQYPGR